MTEKQKIFTFTAAIVAAFSTAILCQEVSIVVGIIVGLLCVGEYFLGWISKPKKIEIKEIENKIYVPFIKETPIQKAPVVVSAKPANSHKKTNQGRKKEVKVVNPS